MSDVSPDPTFSSAIRSYSSHICSVCFGERGGVRESVKGDDGLASDSEA